MNMNSDTMRDYTPTQLRGQLQWIDTKLTDPWATVDQRTELHTLRADVTQQLTDALSDRYEKLTPATFRCRDCDPGSRIEYVERIEHDKMHDLNQLHCPYPMSSVPSIEEWDEYVERIEAVVDTINGFERKPLLLIAQRMCDRDMVNGTAEYAYATAAFDVLGIDPNRVPANIERVRLIGYALDYALANGYDLPSL
jgi:hypothetical protein